MPLLLPWSRAGLLESGFSMKQAKASVYAAPALAN
jgi:hypothetical protein